MHSAYKKKTGEYKKCKINSNRIQKLTEYIIIRICNKEYYYGFNKSVK